MADPFTDLSEEAREALTDEDAPTFAQPMLAVLVHDPFSSPEWIFERKLDGERCVAVRDGDEVHLWSRHHQSLDATYPELVAALAAQRQERFVVDGEVVAFSGSVTSFERLQGRLGIDDPDEARATGVAVFYYLFDVLHLAGRGTTELPQRTRKSLLKRALTFEDPLRFTPHRNVHGERYFRDACGRGWEGLIAKRADAPYAHTRSRDWRKFTCGHRQEFVVVGWTEPGGARIGFGALLLATYDGDALRYHGKVGTGFGDDTLRRLHERLADLETDASPLDDPPDEDDVHWAEPELVAEVGFREWTDADRLRHPRFIGLRDDKPAHDVVRERPA